MTRPPDWPDRALTWFRSLTGEQRQAIARLLTPESAAGQTFAALTYQSLEESGEEARSRLLHTEGKQAGLDLLDWLRSDTK